MRRQVGSVNTGERPATALFQQPWWLEAVAPGQWQIAEVRQNDVLKAWMPYVMKRGPLGLSICSMPRLTQTLGPYIAPSSRPYPRALSEDHRLMGQLIDQLPACDYFSQNLHFSVQNTLPFFWAGYETKVSYTYTINDLADDDTLLSRMHPETRRHLKKAQKRVQVEDTDDLECFLTLNDMTFARQGIKVPYSHEYVRRLDDACAQRDQRRIFLARDAQGRPHAAIYVVFDRRAAYYLMVGSHPDFRESCAVSLCTWEAIKFSRSKSARFDFEGSMMRTVEPFVVGFGAKQTPYYHVRKYSRRFKILMAGRDIWHAMRG
ncbi:MAG: GNAT family N-acetyltransferase [Myxococcota bacterium]|nr:GNAT family N-acetyltransferase [Myxococcota bacterium]